MIGLHDIMEVLIVALDIKAAFRREMAAARSAETRGDLALAKSHLERAHILGQRWFLAHMESHFHMLWIAMKESDSKEVRGQIVRLIGAAPFHLVGWLPVGNTGGANISPTLPMPIPSDLQPYFAGYSLRKGMVARGVVIALVVLAYSLLANG